MGNGLLWVTAAGSVLTALATVGLVVVAARALRGTTDQVRLLREQAEREGRPYLVLDILPGLHGPGSWDLRIRNVGRTIARDVIIAVEGLDETGDGDDISADLKRYLSMPRSLPPGTGQRVMWRVEPDPSTSQSEAGAPSATHASVSYTDAFGESLTDEFDLSVDLYGAISPAPSEGPRVLGNDKELANIERALRTLNQHVGELRR